MHPALAVVEHCTIGQWQHRRVPDNGIDVNTEFAIAVERAKISRFDVVSHRRGGRSSIEPACDFDRSVTR